MLKCQIVKVLAKIRVDVSGVKILLHGPHSAVFKFGGLLRLLDINLTKQDKPIS